MRPLRDTAASLTAFPGTKSGTPTVHRVDVGSNGFSYTPNTTFANPGDIVMFEFYPTNHSVVRAEYTRSLTCGPRGCDPCVPFESIYLGEWGFNSGNFLTQNVDPTSAPTWNLTINDTQPIFFYSAATDSCHPNGMVGVINPNSSVSLSKQYEAAVFARYGLTPGQVFPARDGGSVSGIPISGQQPTAADLNSSSKGTGLSSGAIAGIAIASIVVIYLTTALFYLVGRSKVNAKGGGSGQQDGQGSQMDQGPQSPVSPMPLSIHVSNHITFARNPQDGIPPLARPEAAAELPG